MCIQGPAGRRAVRLERGKKQSQGNQADCCRFGDQGQGKKVGLEMMGALLRQQMRLRQGPTGFVQGGKRGRTAGQRAAQRGAAWLNATEGSGDSKLGTTGGVWCAQAGLYQVQHGRQQSVSGREERVGDEVKSRRIKSSRQGRGLDAAGSSCAPKGRRRRRRERSKRP